MFYSENYLYKLLHKNFKEEFPNLSERSRFNRRRKSLYYLIERLRTSLVQSLVEGEDTFLIDSMPIPIVRLARANRSRVCKEDIRTAPNKGYCASQNQFYYGYKLHAVASMNGVITHFDLSPANVRDIEYLKQIKDYYPGCTLLGDMAYLTHLEQNFPQIRKI